MPKGEGRKVSGNTSIGRADGSNQSASEQKEQHVGEYMPGAAFAKDDDDNDDNTKSSFSGDVTSHQDGDRPIASLETISANAQTDRPNPNEPEVTGQRYILPPLRDRSQYKSSYPSHTRRNNSNSGESHHDVDPLTYWPSERQTPTMSSSDAVSARQMTGSASRPVMSSDHISAGSSGVIVNEAEDLTAAHYSRQLHTQIIGQNYPAISSYHHYSLNQEQQEASQLRQRHMQSYHTASVPMSCMPPTVIQQRGCLPSEESIGVSYASGHEQPRPSTGHHYSPNALSGQWAPSNFPIQPHTTLHGQLHQSQTPYYHPATSFNPEFTYSPYPQAQRPSTLHTSPNQMVGYSQTSPASSLYRHVHPSRNPLNPNIIGALPGGSYPGTHLGGGALSGPSGTSVFPTMVNRNVKPKRKRASSAQVRVLQAVFFKTIFPSTELREAIGNEIGMDTRTVQIWFQNRRQNKKENQRKAEDSGAEISSSDPPDQAPKTRTETTESNERAGWEAFLLALEENSEALRHENSGMLDHHQQSQYKNQRN